MHADGYAGFEALYRSRAIREVACMAQVRRCASSSGIIHRRGSHRTDAVLYANKKRVGGSPSTERRAARQSEAKPIFDELQAWLESQLPNLSGKSPLAAVIRDALVHMRRLRPYLDHGTLEIDNNSAKRAMRSIALGWKNYLSVSSQTGARPPPSHTP